MPARRLSILVVHPEMPLHDRNCGSQRLHAILELLAADGHRITFVSRFGRGQEAYAAALEALGIEVHVTDARRMRARGVAVPGPGLDLPALLRRGRFDLAWLSFHHVAEDYLPEIREHSPATRILIDTVDVHHVRERRGAELAGDPAALAAAERTREREAAVYSRADALVAVSADDARALAELAPAVPVSVLPVIHAQGAAGPGFDERAGLVFVGNFAHAPNADAVRRFHATAWPAVRAAIPGATLAIVGTDPPPAVRELAGDGVTVTGWVPSVAPYLAAARVSIAPLRYGAGVKGKIGEAMANGLPVVTTPIGAEGMGLVDGEHALVAEPGEAFAAAVARLHADRELWERLAAAGRAHVAARQSPAAARDALRALLAAAVPTAFVAAGWDDAAALQGVLAGYLGAFAPDDAVSLVLPAPPGETADAFARVATAVAALGADPEAIPDVAVVDAAPRAALPAGAVAVHAASDWAALARGERPRDEEERPEASIVVLAHGKRDYTERCLASLDRALGPRLGADVELVLVDNASPDDTRELFAAWAGRARVVELDENRNFSGGNNAGAAVARGEVLVFLNNDTEVAAGAIEALVAEARRPGVGIAGARLRYPDGRVQHGGFGWRATPDGRAVPFHLFHFEAGDVEPARASFDVGGVTGACMAIPRAVFDAVGGFDEGYVNGWEDADLCMRVRAAGARVRYRGDVDIVHHEGITTGACYDTAGNAERFAARWADALEADDALVGDVLGAAFSPLIDAPRPRDAAGGAPVRVSGAVAGLGAVAAEARALVAALTAAGAPVAARTPAPTWIGPALADEAPLVAAHARAAAPHAVTVHVPDAGAPAPAGGGGPLVLRLAEAAPRPGDARAWAATPDVAAQLVAAGWPQDAVEPIAPLGIGAACGAGGGGVLVLLPDHDPAAAGALLDALAAGDHGAVRVVPTARTREVVAAVAARLPHAEVLRPVTDEQALAALAATADVVVAADPADRFDRRALVAAAAGAATVVRPGGPAVWVLGDAALVAEPRDAAALAAALAAADTTPAARRARSAAVHEACGADAARRALELLGVAPGAAVPARPDLGDFAWAPALRAERRAAGAATVSAVVNTLNEERNLGDALRSLAWADEVVVVDMHSDDATREIAARHGARVLLHERAGVVEPARDFAIAQATGEWILVLDADERVPEPLARQLDAIAREDAADVVDVPFRNWLCGRWLDATGWGGGDWHIRFFRRGAVRWGDRVHALPEVRGRRARLPVAEGNAILHFNYDDLHQFVAKTNRYTGKEAEAVAGGPTRPWADVVREARGELLARWSPGVDGTQSVALSMAMLFYRFLAGAKQWERHGFPDVGAPATARDALRDLAGEARLEHAAGLQAFDRGDVDAARGHLERAVREAVDPEALNDLAVACHAAGDLDQAEALLRTCLLVAPGHPAAGENLAAVLAERGAAAIG